MIKKIFHKLGRIIASFFAGIWWYAKDIISYRKLLKQNNIATPFYYFPQIFDKDPASHTFDKHYVYMDRWAFQQLLEHTPSEHTDVGSSIRFLSMATTVAQVKFVDIRPVKTDFENYACVEGSILELPFADNSIDSLSCLHVAEHIGLGRYGDPLDPLGTQKACKELSRILKPGGRLYFAGPVGKNTTYFNAHRVHAPSIIVQYFSDLQLVDFAAVDDDGHYHSRAKPEDYEQVRYACGMFIFTK